MTVEIHGTLRSHFTRIVRILCLELGLEHRLHDVGNVAEAAPFGGNPLMTVPVLVDGDRTIWDTRDICRYLVETRGRDPLGVERLDWGARNLVAVIHGVMSAEVRLILAERCGMAVSGPVFDKSREAIRRGLAWLEEHVVDDNHDDALTYPAVWAIAMWDHLLLYGNVERREAPRVDRWVARFGDRPSVASTRPPAPAAR